MRCIACGRSLARAAVEISTRGGSATYGPKCARMAGLVELRRRRSRLFTATAMVEADPRQQDLWGVAA
jgi:hypothetical protein